MKRDIRLRNSEEKTLDKKFSINKRKIIDAMLFKNEINFSFTIELFYLKFIILKIVNEKLISFLKSLASLISSPFFLQKNELLFLNSFIS